MYKLTRLITIIALLALAAPRVSAQDYQQYERADGFDLGANLSASVDWKIRKGLHLNAAEELKLTDYLQSVGKSYTSLGLDWKALRHLKLGASYTFISSRDSEDRNLWKPRHRFSFDAGSSVKFGQWTAALRERLQITHKSYDINLYQQPSTLLELRSRVKLSYSPQYRTYKPYLSFEIKNCLNAADPLSLKTERGLGTYPLPSYTDAYVNRLRTTLGTEWKLDYFNCFDFYLDIDYKYEKELDAKASGRMVSICDASKWAVKIGIAYTFSIL